jgi:SanA protein
MGRLKFFGALLLLVIIMAWVINAYIVVKTKAHIFADLDSIPTVEVVIVPGASVYRSGKLSPVLRQRMQGAIKYLVNHKGTKLLLSGHAIPKGYNETVPMMEFARHNGIPVEDIILDTKGRSTYVTLLNCRRAHPFGRILIVSQDYHLPRAIYIAQNLGFQASGLVVTELNSAIPMREYLVRFKDFILLRISRLFNANAN